MRVKSELAVITPCHSTIVSMCLQ